MYKNDSTNESFRTSINPDFCIQFLPHIDYCSLDWDIGNEYSLERLQKPQNRAARIITGKPCDVRSKDIMEELSWQPLMEDVVIRKIYLCIK